MPSPTPNDGTAKPQLNEWGYVEIPSEGNPVYQTLDTIKKFSDGVFQTIGFFFDAINLVLDFVSSLLVDIGNPLLVLIQEIIALLKSLADDLKNLGLYIAHEGGIFKGEDTFDQLLGGYPAYEQRVVKKILNENDPTRPDFSTNTKVFALHFFAGAGDIGAFSKIYKAIKKLIEMFDTSEDFSGVATPRSLEQSYFQTIGVSRFELDPKDFTQQVQPDGVRLKLTFAVPPPKTSLGGLITVPPKVLICASNKPEGAVLGLSAPRIRQFFEKDSFQDPNLIPVSPSDATLVPAHLYPLVASPQALQSSPNSVVPLGESVKVQEGELRGVGASRLDQRYLTVVQGEDVGAPSTFQRTDKAFVKTIYREGENSFFLRSPTKVVTIDIPKSVLFEGDSEEVYVTCYGMDDDPKGLVTTSTSDSTLVEVKGSEMFHVPTKSIRGLSLKSKTIKVTNSSPLKTQYLQALKEFYAWAFLSGAIASETARKTIFGTSIPPTFTGGSLKVLQGYLSGLVKKNTDRELSAYGLLTSIDQQVKGVTTPPTRLLREFTSDLNTILNYPFSFYEIIEKQAQGGDGGGYFTLPPTNGRYREGVFFGSAYQKTYYPVFSWAVSQASLAVPTPTEAYYDDLGPERYQGHVIYKKSNTEVIHHVVGHLPEVAEILTTGDRLLSLSKPQLARAEGEWIALKPFRDTDFSSFIEYVDTIATYLETLAKALQGLIKAIQDYISIIQTRIAELQAIIAKIKAIIDFILGLRFPAGLYATYHIADGTTGLASAVMRSEQKPRIGADGLGTGLIIVGGGVPTILIELLLAIVGAVKED